MIRPRDSKALQIPVDVNPMLPGWRFVREDTANIRMSSFGTVVGVTAEPPAAGDGTVYEGWLHGWAVGKRRTQQTSASAAYMRFSTGWQIGSLEWNYALNCPMLYVVGTTSLGIGEHGNVYYLFDSVISKPIEVTGADAEGLVVSAKVHFDFSAVSGGLVGTSQPMLRFSLPKLTELGFTPDGLAVKNSDSFLAALAGTAATLMYKPSVAQLNPNSFNQARFQPKMAAHITVTNTTKKASPCVISGRAIPGDSDQSHSAFGIL